MVCRTSPSARVPEGRDEGFTLIEMMVTVAIVGVLATVAIPEYLRYIQRAAHVEGIEAVSKMSAGALTYHQANGMVPVAKADDAAFPKADGLREGSGQGPTIAEICANKGVAKLSDVMKYFKTDKDKYVWDHLSFQPDSTRVRFEYAYWGASRSNWAIMRIQASHLLNCGAGGAPRWVEYHVHLDSMGGTLRKKGPFKREM